jgi:hypothetical protein
MQSAHLPLLFQFLKPDRLLPQPWLNGDQKSDSRPFHKIRQCKVRICLFYSNCSNLNDFCLNLVACHFCEFLLTARGFTLLSRPLLLFTVFQIILKCKPICNHILNQLGERLRLSHLYYAGALQIFDTKELHPCHP